MTADLSLDTNTSTNTTNTHNTSTNTNTNTSTTNTNTMASKGSVKRSMNDHEQLEQKKKIIKLCVVPKKPGYETVTVETAGGVEYYVFLPVVFRAIDLGSKKLIDQCLSKHSVELCSHTDYEYYGTEWADVNLGCTALSYAASKGRFSLCQHLIEKYGADINEGTNVDGDNTLHYAVMCGDVDMVLYLLRRGAEKSNGFSVYSSATEFQYNDNELKIKALLKWYLGPEYVDECENDTDPLTVSMLNVLPKPGTEDFRLYMNNEGVLTEEKVGRAIAALFSARTWTLPFDGRAFPLTVEAPRYNSRWECAMRHVLSKYLSTHDCFRHLSVSAVCNHAVGTELLHVMVSTPAHAYLFHPLFRQVDIGRFYKAQGNTTIRIEKDLLRGRRGLVISMATPHSIIHSDTEESYTSSIVRHVTGKRLLLTPKGTTDDLFNVHEDCMKLLKTILIGCHKKMMMSEAMDNIDDEDCIHTATVFKVEV